jgi:pimeloyl-ACP methyl ester carboxylesterase
VSNTGSKAADGKKEVFPICWPRDWLPSFVPHARILTVAYDIALTKWSSNETAPLKQQAANVLQKLRLMGVGEKPTIFICHSFGGLIAKEMLHMSHKRPEFEAVLKNTKAIIFFSTPHVGSMLAGYANGPTDLVFRGSPAVIELFPTNWYLHHLNAIFPKIAPQIHTLSIGEIETCFLDGSIIEKYACYHIVPDESANPYWPGDQHRFIKLQYNHRQVCKPENQSDERFQLVIDFLRRHAPKL